jgi:hypothetical protein
MQYWGPRAGNIETVTYEPQAPALVSQAGVVQSDETTAAVVNAPEADANIGKVGGDSPNTVAVVCAGEAISNFRMAMKRYSTRCIRQFFQNYNAVEFLNVEWQGSAYPIYRGGTVWQQRALTTIRSFISPAYAGWRGSVRIKQIPITQCHMDNGTMVVRRGTATPDDNTARSVTVTTSVSATPLLLNIRGREIRSQLLPPVTFVILKFHIIIMKDSFGLMLRVHRMNLLDILSIGVLRIHQLSQFRVVPLSKNVRLLVKIIPLCSLLVFRPCG